MLSPIKLTRVYAGRYVTTIRCHFIGGVRPGTHDVGFVIHHQPEWEGPEQWEITAEIIAVDGYPAITLIAPTDSITRTLADARDAVADAAAAGWEWHRGFGYGLRRGRK